MEASAQEKVINALKEKYEEEILHIETPYDFLTITLKKEKIAEIIRYLYDNPETKFQYLTSLGGIHFPDLNQIAVVYQLHNLVTNQRITTEDISSCRKSRHRYYYTDLSRAPTGWNVKPMISTV